MMSKRIFIISLIIIGSLLLPINYIVNSEPKEMFLIKDIKDWVLAGFNPDGLPLYNQEGLTEFYMPIALNKENIKKLEHKDISHTLKHINKNFNDRLRYIDFEIKESNTHWVVIYHMLVYASNKSFSIDFVPKIKGNELTQFAWWDSNWNYFRTLTIDSSFVIAPVNNFTLFISINDSIADLCNNGNSIRFIGTDNVTEYKYEIVTWIDGLNRTVWTKCPRIESSTNTVFLMYYNNSGALDNQDKINTWDSSYVGVWHKNESSGNLYDVSQHSICSPVGNPTYQQSGKIDYAVDYDGNNDYFTGGDDSDYDFGTGNMTVECWLWSNSATNRIIVAKKDWWTHGKGWMLWVGSTTCYMHLSSGANSKYASIGNNLANSNWWYVVGRRWSDTVDISLNYDYALGANSGVSTYDLSTSWDLRLGNDSGNNEGYEWIGKLDEIRISNICRNSSWIKLCFHNQNCTTGFLIWGQVISVPPVLQGHPSIDSYFPSDGSNFSCPCCIVLGVNVSENSSNIMNITFWSNFSDSWILLDNSFNNVSNGSYYIFIVNFTKFNFSYWWNISVESLGNYSNATYQFYTDTFFDCNISGLTEEKADKLFLSSVFDLSTSSLILLIWVFFILLGEWKEDWVYKMIQLPIGLTYGISLLDTNIYLGLGVLFASIYILSIAYWQSRKKEGE